MSSLGIQKLVWLATIRRGVRGSYVLAGQRGQRPAPLESLLRIPYETARVWIKLRTLAGHRCASEKVAALTARPRIALVSSTSILCGTLSQLIFM